MKEKIYFPGLNSLRFFAALSVIFYHLSITEIFGKSRQYFFLSHFVLDGGDAVTLFFVLSGFLITYLLLTELKVLGTIQIRKFYVRRILRIWPLYYFMVFLGFVIFPLVQRLTGDVTSYSLLTMHPKDILVNLGAHLALLPHVSLYFGFRVDSIEQLWSIGVEETFYLMWPVLVFIFRKRILLLLLGFIGFKLGCQVVAAVLSHWGSAPQWLISAVGLINFTPMQNMAMGGLGAYILFTNRQRILSVIFHPVVEKGVLLVMAANILLFQEAHHSFGVRAAINLFLSVVYILLILNISCNPRSTLKLEHPIFTRLGRISYGIYVYHLFIMSATAALFSKGLFLTNDSPLLTLLLYIFITLVTIGVAHVSYYYFEERFLRLKTRFVVIKSGEPDTATPAISPVQYQTGNG